MKLLVVRRSHHGNEASDEAEVGEVVGVDGRSRVNLQTVVVFTGILKQTVHGIQHLVRQQEKPLPTDRNRRHYVSNKTTIHTPFKYSHITETNCAGTLHRNQDSLGKYSNVYKSKWFYRL